MFQSKLKNEQQINFTQFSKGPNYICKNNVGLVLPIYWSPYLLIKLMRLVSIWCMFLYLYNSIKNISKWSYQPTLCSNCKLYHIHFYCFFAYVQEVFSPNSSCFSLVNVVFVTFRLQRPFFCFGNLQISCNWRFSVI